MKTACKSQCKECPFRSKSLPGWLGAYAGPEAILHQLWHGEPFFCHARSDYEREDWLEVLLDRGELCLGALLYVDREKYMPRPADPEIANAMAWASRQFAADPERFDVMSRRSFIAHHNKFKVTDG